MSSKPSMKDKGIPIQAKNDRFDFIDPGFATDLFALDSSVKKELEDKGLVGRFVNVAEIEKMGGHHQKGWKVYKRDNQAASSKDFLFGADPNGYIRRGDTVLAVKTKEDAKRHKAYLDQLASAANVKNLMKRQKDEQRRYFKEAGMDKYSRSVEDSDD